ncbi:electron transport complex subunit RsxA [Mahella australiensis]|uniref:Ion-translocating oxidoreductase complex subunit A n=1 Tax=Mahella australiensis (strain DSM 15567 / CIP 107919 / 50-1 BON) TaxID=697281 RepID=F3ZVJ2_MAHA5|nr:electron transport complex subunit RsxA [Mahella australiensis]AEE96354.1 electron transport complex, RnfABCDGE type, A subunit [Mahella australiensis 50-1 BON]
MDAGRLFYIVVSGILVNNFIMSRFLGICPFLGVSKRVETALSMGIAVTFVMGMASVVTYVVQYALLELLGLEYLQTIAYILVIATLVQFVEMVIQKTSPTLYQALGIYLPLITTNCAVLGVTLLNMQYQYNLLESLVNGIAGALGFTLAIVLFAAIREQMDFAPIPESMKGFPIALVSAGLMSLAFLGFQGLVK